VVATTESGSGLAKRADRKSFGFFNLFRVGSNLLSDEIDSIVLQQLLAICGDQADVNNDLRDIKARLASIESHIATLHSDQAQIGAKLDDIIVRVERLERARAIAQYGHDTAQP
jgi:hypothetical protein